MMKNQRVSRATNAYQKKILWVVFAAAAIPIALLGAALAFLLADTGLEKTRIEKLWQIGFGLIFTLPLAFLWVWYWALAVTHRLLGPLERIEREVVERVQTGSTEPIHLRPKDDLRTMIEGLNTLIDRPASQPPAADGGKQG